MPFVAKAGVVAEKIGAAEAILMRGAEASAAAREAKSRALECQNVSPT